LTTDEKRDGPVQSITKGYKFPIIVREIAPFIQWRPVKPYLTDKAPKLPHTRRVNLTTDPREGRKREINESYKNNRYRTVAQVLVELDFQKYFHRVWKFY